MNSLPPPRRQADHPNQRVERFKRSGNCDFLKTSLEEAFSGSFRDMEDTWGDENAAGKEDDKSERNLITWSVGFILLVSTVGLIFLRFGTASGSASPSAHAPANFEVETRLSDFVENSTTEDLEESAVESIRGFMEADTLDAATKFIVGGGERASLLEDFYRRPGNFFPNGFKKVIQKIPNALAEVFYFEIFVTDQDDIIHQFIVVPVGEKMLVDWACSVAYGELSKEDFFAQKPDSPKKMRFYVEPFHELTGKMSSIQLVKFDMAEVFYFESSESIGLELNDQFLQLSDLNAKEVFTVRYSPVDPYISNLVKILREQRARLPIQLTLVWNHELDCPEISSLECIWWFDLKGVKPESLPSDTSGFEKMDITKIK